MIKSRSHSKITILITSQEYSAYSKIRNINKTTIKDTIMKQVNNYIVLHNIQQFMQIQIRIQNKWQRINQVPKQDIENFDMYFNKNQYKHLVDIRLINQVMGRIRDIQCTNQWESRIQECKHRLQSVHNKIINDACKIKDQEQYDLAILYAEPLVQRTYHKNDKELFKETNRQVSFLKQIDSLIYQLDESNKKSIRSANLQIKVATIRNLKIILAKGVKILHFSCHGKQLLLQIQRQYSLIQNRVGISYYLQPSQLVQILINYKLPDIIVFNSCDSDSMAKHIHQYFHIRGQQVATIGYTVKIKDSYCQNFSKVFYSTLIKGKKIIDAYRQAHNTEDIRLYCTDKDKVVYTKFGVRNEQKFHTIKDKTINDKYDMIYPKMRLFNFFTFFMRIRQEQLFNIIGPSKLWKSQITKKLLSYIWQRDVISEYFIIDLKFKNYKITNVVQFRSEIQKQFRKFNIYRKVESGQNNFIVAFDHCDSLLEYDKTEFYDCIQRFVKKIGNNKFILVSRTPMNFKNLSIRMINLTDYFNVDKKKEHQIQQQQKQTKKIMGIVQLKQGLKQQFMQGCYNYIKQSLHYDQINIDKHIPGVCMLSNRLYSQLQDKVQKDGYYDKHDLTWDCKKIIILINYQIEQLKKSTFNSTLTINNKTQIQQIFFLMNLLLPTLLLISEDEQIIFNRYNYNKIMRSTHELINFCLFINKLQYNNSNKQAQQQLELQCGNLYVKLNFLIYHLNKSKRIRKYNIIVYQSLKYVKWPIFKYFQEFYGITPSMLVTVSQKSISLNQQLETSQDWCLFEDKQIEQYIKNIKIMKVKCKQRQNTQRYNNIYHLYEQRQVNMLFLQLLPCLKYQLQKIYSQKIVNSDSKNSFHIKQKILLVKDLAKQIKQIYENEKDNDQLQTFTYQAHQNQIIQVFFLLQKVQLKYQQILGIYLDKYQVGQKLNYYTSIWRKNKKNKLVQSVQNYRKINFIKFPIYTESCFLNNNYRFYQDICDMSVSCFLLLNRKAWCSVQKFKEQNFIKAENLNFVIPVGLYIKDIVSSQQIHKNTEEIKYYFRKSDTRSSINPQQLTYIPIKKILKQINAKICIFFGRQVDKISQNKRYIRSEAVIIINTDIPKQIQQKIRKDYKNCDKSIKQCYFQMLYGEITKTFITNFYPSFVKSMFETKSQNNMHMNRLNQIKQAFIIAKLKAKIACFNKLGLYQQQIAQFCKNNVVCHILKQTCNLSIMQLRGKNDMFQAEYHYLHNDINCTSKNYKSEIGHCQKLQQICKQIQNMSKVKGSMSQSLIIICLFQEADTIIRSLYLKMKFMEGAYVQLIDNRRKNSNPENQIYHIHSNDQNKRLRQISISIMNLTNSSINNVNETISNHLEQQRELLNSSSKYKERKITIFVINNIPLKVKDIKTFEISMLQYQNIVPIFCHKAIMKKTGKRQMNRNWEQPFFKKLNKKIENNSIATGIYQISKQNSSMNWKNKKQQHIKTINDIFNQLIV